MNTEKLTKREYFAIEAAKAILSKGNESIYIVAGKAVLFADDLLEKLNKEWKDGNGV